MIWIIVGLGWLAGLAQAVAWWRTRHEIADRGELTGRWSKDD